MMRTVVHLHPLACAQLPQVGLTPIVAISPCLAVYRFLWATQAPETAWPAQPQLLYCSGKAGVCSSPLYTSRRALAAICTLLSTSTAASGCSALGSSSAISPWTAGDASVAPPAPELHNAACVYRLATLTQTLASPHNLYRHNHAH